MIQLLKKILSSKYKRSIKDRLGVPSLHWSLQNLKQLGYYPRFAIDVGAYEGNWTKEFIEVFPKSIVLMIEAQQGKIKKLEEVCCINSNASYHIALLSDKDGKVTYFHENETASHVTDLKLENTVTVITEALDTILVQKAYSFPDFLKLDVQGHELDVLRGAIKTLAQVEFCLLEVSLLKLGNEPLVSEIIHFMDEKHFQPYDICQFMRRPFDKALYQIDLLFIRKDSKYIKEKRWN
jgi:FkbM family methyltransferase